MTDRQSAEREIAALEHALERLGADQARWPETLRARFAPLIASDRRAARLMDEARALDTLLEAAPRTGHDRHDTLAQRIVAAATAADAATAVSSGRVADDRVVPFPGPRSSARGMRPTRSDWQAAALLAASLLVGVFVGASGSLGTAISGLSSLAGLSTDQDGIVLALDQTSLPVFDEDAL